MSNSTLNRIIEMATKARDESSKLLAQEQVTVNQIKDQIATLTQYKASYQAELASMMRQPHDVNQLFDYQAFLKSLDNAIELAHQQLDAQESCLEQAKEAWREKQKKLTSYEKLNERQIAQLVQAEKKKESKLTDEINTNKSARKLS